MAREAKYFSLSLESLRSLGSWAADCAERALTVYENQANADSRPRAAIEGIRVFANGGKRSAQLRLLSLAAFSAARDAESPAAIAAARAAGLAASSAYTHPLVDIQQTKHIVGPAAYAALALELDQGGDHSIGDNEISWAVSHVTPGVCEILLHMPPHEMGKTRLKNIMHKIDASIRGRN
ncbi:MAG: hypothetical protein HYZ25_21175 [Chloroflexi bacterium]|nr:hypothetical protein [Chloroflexota bacterium]